MEKSFGLLFFLKKQRAYKPGEGMSIYMRITVDSKYVEVSTKRKCEPSKWNAHAGRANNKLESYKEFNAYLDTLQQKVFEAKRKLLELDKDVNPSNIKDLLIGNDVDENKRMLMKIFAYHNEQMQALVGKEYSAGTMQRYEVSLRHTLSFLEWKYKIKDIDIKKLDYEFLKEYEFWLKTVRKCDHNTTMKYLNNFRKIVNICIKSGWLQRDPFLGFNMAKRPVDRVVLTETELNALAQKEFSIPRLAIVRDVFLFSCFSGLAYADVANLKRSDIVIGIDGEKWIVCKRQKTRVPARIPLLPAALDLIAKYEKELPASFGDHVFPVFSNQKMNAYLKEIADICGVHKTLTYHIARHTFATTVTLSNGVPIETVSKMLGHRSLRTTEHYAKILDKKISEDMQQLIKRLQKKESYPSYIQKNKEEEFFLD
ncbi:site-specific integrase [Chitinophagaceae bacterium 26-R-25]|nr:site-specific integrase [Chitinophagaceae bacterium 26-R-25]